MDKKEAKVKAAAYCAYQERTQQEVRDKLYSYGLYGNEVEEVIADLIAENFINEERFAKAYAGGKFRMKKWGRKKIRHGLLQHGISDYCIRVGLEEISDEDYGRTLESLIDKKWSSIMEDDDYKRKNKVAVYVIGKGYEPDLVWDFLKKLG
jgi:regulatory protein